MDRELEQWLDTQFDDLVKALEDQEKIAGAWPDVFPFRQDDDLPEDD